MLEIILNSINRQAHKTLILILNMMCLAVKNDKKHTLLCHM